MSYRNRRRSTVKGKDGGNNMDQTCIDTDDDDLEFESARQEENEDVMLHELSEFMVNKNNMSRYQEMTRDQIVETQEEEEESQDNISLPNQ